MTAVGPHLGAVLVLLGLGALTSPELRAATAATCELETVRVDISYADDYVDQYLGGAAGQIFLARDSLIKSISVWRKQWPGPGVPAMKLWITGLVSGTEDWVLLEGPTIHVAGDTVTRAPVKCQWVFDPPFALPAAGRSYAFHVQDPCVYYFDLYLHTGGGDVYPHGQLLRTSRGSRVECAIQGPSGQFYELYDLIFEIEFCNQAATPVKRSTWGRLKVIYR